MLCGLVCGGAKAPAQTWIDQVVPLTDPGDLAVTEARQLLVEIGAAIENRIHDPDLSIQIVPADDARPLVERAIDVYDWVRGFLFALGVLGVSESSLSEQGREILRDFAAMTRMDLDDLDDSEENEQALTEITEFIRVAAMLIHDERASGSETRAP